MGVSFSTSSTGDDSSTVRAQILWSLESEEFGRGDLVWLCTSVIAPPDFFGKKFTLIV
jgi:hypothetical protein